MARPCEGLMAAGGEAEGRQSTGGGEVELDTS